MGSASGSLKSINGCNSKMSWEQLQDLKDQKIIRAGIIFTPLDQRKTVKEIALGVNFACIAYSSLFLFVFPPASLAFSTVGIISSTAGLVSAVKMFHFKILLDLGNNKFIIISYGKNGIQCKVGLNFLHQYEERQTSHPKHVFDYNYIHKTEKAQNVIQIFSVKQSAYFRDIKTAMKSVQNKNYCFANWNCKDFTHHVINSIRKVD